MCYCLFLRKDFTLSELSLLFLFHFFMAAYRHSGTPKISNYLIKKASTAIAIGDVVTIEDATGYIIPAVAGSTQVKGVAQERIASTDTDYATARNTTVDVPLPGDLFEIACNTTITQAMVGDLFDLASAGVLDNSDALGAVDVLEIVAIKKATYVDANNPSIAIVRFNPAVLLSVSATA